jgi:predicted transposase/invertase (TIGR01784 family)
MIFLDPKNDVAFKRVFGSEEHKNITISFLNSILENTGPCEIKSIEFLNNEQLPLMDEKKKNILDVFCIDASGVKYIVEIQVKRVKEFGKRMVYYGAKTYSMQLGKGKPYHQLTPVITLAIVDFKVFPKKKAYKSIHHLLDNKTHEHDLKELSFVFVELQKFHKKESELVTAEDKWIYFIKQIKEQHHIPEPLAHGEFEEACHVVERMKWSEAELNAYDDAFVRETDIQTNAELAREDGIKKGKTEGLKEGFEKGKAEKALDVARTLLAKNIELEIIAQSTGLTIGEIEKLKK